MRSELFDLSALADVGRAGTRKSVTRIVEMTYRRRCPGAASRLPSRKIFKGDRDAASRGTWLGRHSVVSMLLDLRMLVDLCRIMGLQDGHGLMNSPIIIDQLIQNDVAGLCPLLVDIFVLTWIDVLPTEQSSPKATR
jgi:hypothetical protein